MGQQPDTRSPADRGHLPEWDCRTCKVRTSCTSGFTRRLTLHPRDEHELLQHQSTEQETDAWKRRSNKRAGVEGTISQAVRTTGIRRSRYRGQAKPGLSPTSSAPPPSTCTASKPT
ncbi:transposase [Streptacidiphilus neutrinimicus]|uniref:transposase n=1 Tax=Streptacidiphilus neutrinimicus TaxID=105420 RepID=UPI0034E269ED